MMANNGIDWYACIMLDGTVELKHQTSLSSILQCNMPCSDYDIDAIYRCGSDDTDEALEAIDSGYTEADND
jgi:hypothetical protein